MIAKEAIGLCEKMFRYRRNEEICRRAGYYEAAVSYQRWADDMAWEHWRNVNSSVINAAYVRWKVGTGRTP